MRMRSYDLNKLSSIILIHKTIDLIFIYNFFFPLSFNFLKLDFLKLFEVKSNGENI
jgi:hypothetical protein